MGWLLCFDILSSMRRVRTYDNMRVCECVCVKGEGRHCIFTGWGEGGSYVGHVCCRLLTLR